MPDNNFNSNSLYPNVNNGQKVGAPPVSEIEVRTMQGDVKSVQRGEINPVPESVLPPIQDKAPEFKPETVSSSDKVQEENLPKKSHTWLYTLIILIVVLGAGYYFFSDQILGFLGLGSMKPVVTETNTPPQTHEPVQQIPKAIHQSLFSNPQEIVEVKIPSFNYDNFLTFTKQGIDSRAQTVGSLLEVGIYDDNGSQIAFSSFLPAFFPIDSNQLSSWFNDDFTFFSYLDDKGNWPGFIAEFKNTANLTDALATIKSSIEVQDLKKFFLSDPGTFQAFKDGMVGTNKTRYASATKSGASLNYGIFGNYFIVSTSYNGLKAAVAGLGL